MKPVESTLGRLTLSAMIAWAALATRPSLGQDREARDGRNRPAERDRASDEAANESDDSASEPLRARVARERNQNQDREGDRASADLRLDNVRAADLGLWFRRQTRDGLVIADVAPSGVIGQYGFREADRIVSVNGLPVKSEVSFLEALLAQDVLHERVPIVMVRDGRRQIIYVRPEVFVTQLEAVSVDPLERLGIELDDRYTSRIVVWRVIARSPAYYAGIRAGDIIRAFDGQRVFDAGEFVRLLDRAEPTVTDVEVIRGQDVKSLAADLSIDRHIAKPQAVVVRPMRMDRTFDDINSVDPYSDRRLSPRPDVRPGMRVPGGEVGRDRGPISPPGAALGTPTTPPTTGVSR